MMLSRSGCKVLKDIVPNIQYFSALKVCSRLSFMKKSTENLSLEVFSLTYKNETVSSWLHPLFPGVGLTVSFDKSNFSVPAYAQHLSPSKKTVQLLWLLHT